ncbi:MAG: MSHA biogenesis protein MshE, partial [Gammaproteobacteria bacterium]|nr:MSHA biogenesis protein MshE [Gammaproteobacteria bacterium]
KRAAKTEFLRGRGCNYCQLTGYRGRIGVYELLEMDNGLTDALRREDLSEFVSLAAKKKSYVPLVSCALDYAAAGVTSLEEVIRVAGGLDGDDESAIDAAVTAAGGTDDG